MPSPFLVKPPSTAWSPGMSLCCNACAMVILKLAVLKIAPPLRTLASVSPVMNAALLPVGDTIVPLKLLVALRPVLEAKLNVLTVPPLRFSVPAEPAIRAVLKPALAFTTAVPDMFIVPVPVPPTRMPAAAVKDPPLML